MKGYLRSALITLSLFLITFSWQVYADVVITKKSSPDGFYVDTNISPQVLGQYVAYAIQNTSATDIDDAWVELTNFTGGKVVLAANESSEKSLGALAAGQTKVAYFYLAATATSPQDQSHDVKVYDGRVGVGPLITATGDTSNTFTEVKKTISASPNTVFSVVAGPSSPALGGEMTLTVTGKTGKMGSAKIFNLTPACYTDWPANVYQLTGSSVALTGGNTLTYSDELYKVLPGDTDTNYSVVYTFRAVGTSVAPAAVSPLANISSGNPLKHTVTSSFASFPPVPVVSNSIYISNVAVTPNTFTSATGGIITYRISFTNTHTTMSVDLDDIIEQLPATTTYQTSSSTFAGLAISDPDIAGQSLTWARRFTVPAKSTVDLTYDVFIPNTIGVYDNSIVANIGSVQIDTTLLTSDNLPGVKPVVVDVVDAAISTISANPATIIADGSSTTTITVQAKNATGDELVAGGETVTLATDAGTITGVTDNGDGTYTATLTSNTIVGTTANITGTMNGISMTATTVQFTELPDPLQATIVASPILIAADGSDTSTITVQAKDGGGVNLTNSGGEVILSTTLGTLTAVIDNGDGTYTATLSGTTVGLATISGTINSGAITNTVGVTFVVGAASSVTSTIVANPTSITADGVSTSTITLQLKDAGGNNLTMGGDTVTIATTAGTVVAPVTDNMNGTYTTTLTSDAVGGIAIVNGTVNGVMTTNIASVIFAALPGAADETTTSIVASPASIVADGSTTSTITVQAYDIDGIALSTGGDAVILSTTSGTLSAVTDNLDGTYTATLTSSITASTATISGSINAVAITDTAAVSYTVGAASAVTSSIVASPTSIAADGISTSAITVQAIDANGNNLTAGGDAVLLSTTSGTLSAVTDNGNGTYSATLTSSTTASVATISGSISAVAITDTAAVSFTLVIGSADATMTTIVAGTSSIVADGVTTSTITVQAVDSGGNNLTSGGDTVLLSTTSGTLSAVTDNLDGTYTATLTSSTTAGGATISGSINAVAITDTAAVTYIVGAVSAVTSSIVASPISIVADGVTTSTITVQAIDANGNNLATGGDAVLLSTTSGTLSAVTDNLDGTYTVTLTSSTTAGGATISGSINAVAMTDTAAVTYTAGAASVTTSSIVASPISIVADGSSTSVITVQAIDANGNNLATGGDVVLLSTTSGTLSAVTDNLDGTYTAILTSSTTAGGATISGSINAVAITDTAAVTYTVGAVSAVTSTVTSAAASLVADGLTTTTITVQAIDANGNNLTTGGDTVLLSTTSGALSAVTDNGNGTYSATLTSSTLTDTATITGTINGVAISDSASVIYTSSVGPADATMTTIVATSTSIVADGTTTSTITVQAVDSTGTNLIAGGDTVILSTTSGTLSTVTDNLDGTYTATLTSSTTAGAATISGSINAVAITDTAAVSFTLDPAGDEDGDGISNGDETSAGSDPTSTDSDGDGISDAVEFGDPSNPIDSDGDGTPDVIDTDSDNDGTLDSAEGVGDTDGDGIPDYVDAINDINQGGDSDGDGISDALECPTYPCLDSDNDGIPNYADADSDNDGVNDVIEMGVGVLPIDTDGDGIADYLDNDSDNDGTTDIAEGTGDTDGDGIPDYLDADSLSVGAGDSDGDGIADNIECASYPGCTDSDSDGVPDYMDTDSDNDGISDAIEVGIDALPRDTDNDGMPDYQDTDSDNDGVTDVAEGTGDTDGDGIPNFADADDSNVALTADGSGDSDNDGLSDFAECPAYPTCADADSDGVVDYMDAFNEDGPTGDLDTDGIQNMLDSDDNGDGVPDVLLDPNVDADNNPYTNPVDTDGDGIADYQDLDSDGDGISDAIETGASGVDSDGDGIDDSFDVDATGGVDANADGVDDNIVLSDSDSDGIPDYVDVDSSSSSAGDSDGDGIADDIECPTYPDCSDTDSDGIPDYMESDSDNDGISDVVEAGSGNVLADTDADGLPNYQDSDSDNDGVDDIDEVAGDSDGDSIPDSVDADDGNVAATADGSGDSDGDGTSDNQECPTYPHCNDSNADGTPDYMDPNYSSAPVITTGLKGLGGLDIWLLMLLMGSIVALRTISISNTDKRAMKVFMQCLAFATIVLPATVSAKQSETDKNGWYLGAGLGQSKMEPDMTGTVFSIDENIDSAYKIYGGYDINEAFSVELFLSNLGTTKLQPIGEIDYTVSGAGLLYYFYDEDKNDHIGWGSYIKAGVAAIENTATVPYKLANPAQIYFGIGLEHAWENGWATRLDLESYDTDAALLTVGLLYRFGSQEAQPKKIIIEKPVAVVEPVVAPVVASVVVALPKDNDGDGVLNEADQCPNSIEGSTVNKVGCNIFETVIEGVNFKPASAELSENAKVILDEVAIALSSFPQVKVEVQAHTDSIGKASYNKNLSNKRAASVKRYLVSKGIAENRMISKGYGESAPIDSNKTKQGRKKNRRVEFKLLD